MLHKLIRYLFHQKPELKRRPRQYINEYDIKAATEDELMLMKAVMARSPEEAKRLMQKHKSVNIYELMVKLETKKPSILARAKSRAVALWMRIEGSSHRHPIDKKRYRDESKLDSPYVWKDE